MESIEQVTLSQSDTGLVLNVCNSDDKKDSATSIPKMCGDLPMCEAALCDISKEVSKKCGEHFLAAKNEDSSKYYAVSFPQSLAHLIDKDHPLIFQNKIDALQAIKQYSEARFREFKSRIDAVKYASVPLYPQTAPSLKENGEKTPFKSISSQEMVQLRKAIESGNEGLFLERVWSNPRYLINSADGPTVMQEGTRYNALHVTARFKQTGMCLTILSVIHDKQFVSRLYPEDKPSMIKERIKHLVDLYLNMPDKSLSESPVHFASKFGVDSILAILLSYPECDVNKLNKYGNSPKEVICDRHICDSGNHKKVMRALFEDIFYVPIMRDELHKFVGKPCRASAVLIATSYPCNEESSVIYCAFAGPMSESAATKFCTLLKTKRLADNSEAQKVPFSPEEMTLIQICLADSKKGLERVGRKLALNLSTGWLEFWNSLDCWLDLSSDFGLDYLNSYLKKQDEVINSEESDLPLFTELVISFIDEFVRKLPMILISKNKMTFFQLFQTLMQHMCCFTKFTYSQENEISLIHEEIGHLLYLKISADNKNNFDALKFYLNTQLNVAGSMQAPKLKMFLCILKFACYFQASKAMFLKLPVCDCEYVQRRDSYDYSSKLCYFSILSLRQQFLNNLSDVKTSVIEKSSVTGPSVNQMDEIKSKTSEETQVLMNQLSLDCVATTSKDKTVDEKSGSLLSTSGIYNLIKKLRFINDTQQDSEFQESLVKSSCSVEDDDDKFFTPPESPLRVKRRVFVKGEELSDDDIDIFRAVVDAGVCRNTTVHPYVFKWKCLMESTLGPVLKLHDRVSCTPTSSSATVRRAVTPQLESLRRTLF